ncbi:MAG: WYL domain-containing protein [Corynebacterium sp.]|uniref:helix-turn-helix transcriptional regulator n=1 Tax=Corynebacterium sp. TaxID=1720 RepID=UPI0026DCBC93|nr:WYL domain-containing protein [Corynebacterium sp.]MDO4762726.1 WYL domain-containing protein [Corynebacterium sp.]
MKDNNPKLPNADVHPARKKTHIPETRWMDMVRMLNILPYFEKHPGRSLMAAAVDLGTDVKTLRADLNRLFCCGIGPLPHQLVDLDPEMRSVRVFNHQGMDRALRLTLTEANALVLALDSLGTVAGLVDDFAVRSASQKLRSLMGEHTPQVSGGDSSLDDPTVDSSPAVATDSSENGGPAKLTADDETSDSSPGLAHTLGVLRQAMETTVEVGFQYYSRTKDTWSHRHVSPTRIFSREGTVYLAAYDSGVKAHRNFRIELMHNVECLSTPATPKLSELTFDSADPFCFSSATDQAQIVFYPESTWLAETIPCEVEGVDEDGNLWVTLPLVSREWLIQFALAHADRMWVEEPKEVAHAISERASTGLRAYDEGVVTDI